MWEYKDGLRSQTQMMYTEESKPVSGFWNQVPGILADDFYAEWDNNEYTTAAYAPWSSTRSWWARPYRRR